MRTMTHVSVAVLISGVVGLGATVAATSRPISQAPPPAVPSAADRFPETTGKATLLKVCSNCHTAESVVQSLRTRQEWSDVVDQMSRYGAEANDQEFEQILTYLVKHFSPIRINKATAKDLESTLSVPPEVAAAIVAYRTEKGDFKTIDEVQQVQGLESGKLDAQKARLVF